MNAVLVVGRFVHIGAAMLLFGSAAFDAFVAPAVLRGRLWPLGSRFRFGLAVIIALTAMLWLGAEAAMLGDGWSDAFNPAVLVPLATATDFGAAWLFHLALIAVLLFALALRGSAPRAVLPVLSTLVLASIGLVGHAAMQEGPFGLLHRGNDVLHLLAAGFWLGALPPLVATLRSFKTDRADAVTALRRFSGLGHAAVAVVLITGIVNTWLTLGRLPIDFSSPYQLLLAIKLALVTAMLALALANRYVVTPRLGNGPPRALIAGAVVEIGLGVGVVALVSAFGTLDPA